MYIETFKQIFRSFLGNDESLDFLDENLSVSKAFIIGWLSISILFILSGTLNIVFSNTIISMTALLTTILFISVLFLISSGIYIVIISAILNGLLKLFGGENTYNKVLKHLSLLIIPPTLALSIFSPLFTLIGLRSLFLTVLFTIIFLGITIWTATILVYILSIISELNKTKTFFATIGIPFLFSMVVLAIILIYTL